MIANARTRQVKNKLEIKQSQTLRNNQRSCRSAFEISTYNTKLNLRMSESSYIFILNNFPFSRIAWILATCPDPALFHLPQMRKKPKSQNAVSLASVSTAHYTHSVCWCNYIVPPCCDCAMDSIF